MIPDTIEFFEYYYHHPSGGYAVGWADREYLTMLRAMKCEPVLTGESRSIGKPRELDVYEQHRNTDTRRKQTSNKEDEG